MFHPMFIGGGGGGHIVMTPHGPVAVGGGGGGDGHIVMTPHGPVAIRGGGGGGGHIVMTPHGPMAIGGGGGGGGHAVMTPHGLMMVGGGGGGGYSCKYCHHPIDGDAWTSDSDASDHPLSCPRRREYEEKKEATARAAEEEAAAARHRIARHRIETAAAEARRAATAGRLRTSWASRRRELGVLTRSMMDSRRGRRPTPRMNPEQRSCANIATTLIANSPFRGVDFEKLITPTPTGQAIVMAGSFSGRKVAIKIYLQNKTSEFQDEIRIMTRIGQHRNITSLVTSFDSPRDAIVLPFAEKGSLRALLEDGALPNVMVVQYAKQIADGLCHIHSKGIAHLDMKADNILIDSKNVAQITDFGLSEEYTGDDSITLGRGTMMFIAPEGLFYSGGTSDASKMDTYAFGMVMYEMLTGNLPYEELFNGDEDEFNNLVAEKVAAGDTPATDRRWDLQTVGVMKRCWAKQSTSRPPMREVKSLLSGL
jgi:serine/threonine protein kinase